MSFSSLSLDALKAFRAAIDAEISSRNAPVKAEKAEKPKVKRAAGAHALWLGHVIKAHVPEYESFKAAAESKKGVALSFAKQWRADHAEEFAAFVSQYKDAKDASEAASEAAAATFFAARFAAAAASEVSESESVSKPKKERKPWTPEQKAAAAAKRAAKKASA